MYESVSPQAVFPPGAPIAGGAGIPLYLAGLLLIPEEGSGQSIAGSLPGFLRSRS